MNFPRGFLVENLVRLQTLHSACNPGSSNRTCIIPQCKRGQCTVVLPPQGVLSIDCDKCGSFPKGKRKPDFIVLYAGGKSSVSSWIIIEMKRSVSHSQHIIEQLQAGADVIQNDPSFKIAQSPPHLIALLLHDKHIRTADFVRKRITFRGNPVSIIYKRCGTRLEDHLV